MKLIKATNKAVASILGKQTYYPRKSYRHSSYQRRVVCDDGILVENTLTRQLMLLSDNELSGSDEAAKKALVENWYMIPEDVSEKSLHYAVLNSVRTQNAKIQNANYKTIRTFTIFTTTECNARCPYCYEAGREQIPMTEEVASNVISYIEKTSNGGGIWLRWFGGEPLYNKDIIDFICQKLSDKKIPYKSSMISNGYLLKDCTESDIKDVWNLAQIQITLDGTKDIYNAVKGYVDDPENAFDIVLNNIEMLLKLSVKVSVRMNQSMENTDDLIELIGILTERFGQDRNFSAYAHPLFEDCNNKLSDKEWSETYDKYIEVDRALIENGLKQQKSLDYIQTKHCMADAGDSVCISPTGMLTLCEHYSDEEIVGNVIDGVTNFDLVNEWHEMSDEKDECASCWYYPKCVRLKKCFSSNECDLGAKKFWEYREDQAILKVYENYLEKVKESEMKNVEEAFDVNTVVKVAKEEIGKSLLNRNYWNEVYPNKKERGWCLVFLYAIFIQAYGNENAAKILRSGHMVSIPAMYANFFKRMNRLYDTPKVGDIVFYQVSAMSSHAGIVVEVKESERTFNSIEGNIVPKQGSKESKVCLMKNVPYENNKFIIGFGRPNYENE